VSSPYRDKVIEAFRQHKTPLHMDVELPTLQAIKRFVGMGKRSGARAGDQCGE